MNSADTNLANDFAKARDLRNELRRLEAKVSEEANRSPLTIEDEQAMARTQARLDEGFQAADRRALPPLPYERPASYSRRLLSDLARYSPNWAGKDLSQLRDPTAAAAVEQQIIDHAKQYGPRHGLAPTEIRERETRGSGGHIVKEFVGGDAAWFGNAFTREPRRAQFASPQEYREISKNNLLSRITERVPGWAREIVRGGSRAF
jgi:hypothetical protein